MIDQLVSVAIDSLASRAELVFLEQANYDAKQIMKCLSDLRALPPLPSLADAIDWEERFILLEGVMSVRHLGVPALEYLFLSNENNLAKLLERELRKDKVDSKEDEVLDDVTGMRFCEIAISIVTNLLRFFARLTAKNEKSDFKPTKLSTKN